MTVVPNAVVVGVDINRSALESVFRNGRFIVFRIDVPNAVIVSIVELVAFNDAGAFLDEDDVVFNFAVSAEAGSGRRHAGKVVGLFVEANAHCRFADLRSFRNVQADQQVGSFVDAGVRTNFVTPGNVPLGLRNIFKLVSSLSLSNAADFNAFRFAERSVLVKVNPEYQIAFACNGHRQLNRSANDNRGIDVTGVGINADSVVFVSVSHRRRFSI